MSRAVGKKILVTWAGEKPKTLEKGIHPVIKAICAVAGAGLDQRLWNTGINHTVLMNLLKEHNLPSEVVTQVDNSVSVPYRSVGRHATSVAIQMVINAIARRQVLDDLTMQSMYYHRKPGA